MFLVSASFFRDPRSRWKAWSPLGWHISGMHTIKFQFAAGQRQSPLNEGIFQLPWFKGLLRCVSFRGVFEVTLLVFAVSVRSKQRAWWQWQLSSTKSSILFFCCAICGWPLKMFECGHLGISRGWRQATRMLLKLQALRKQRHTQGATDPPFFLPLAALRPEFVIVSFSSLPVYNQMVPSSYLKAGLRAPRDLDLNQRGGIWK